MLPADCFGGRGSTIGPKAFMTDDGKSERQAPNKVSLQSVLLLCIFHILQVTWCWLWNANHKVPLKETPNYLHHLKRMVFASSEEVKKLYEASMANNALVNCLTRNGRLEIKHQKPYYQDM